MPPPSATAAAGLEGQAEPLLPADGAAAAGGGGTMATAGAADSGAQQSAAAAPSEATAAAADGGSGGGGAGAGEPEPKRRRRAAVDYVALNKQLEAEQAAKVSGCYLTWGRRPGMRVVNVSTVGMAPAVRRWLCASAASTNHEP